MLSLDPFCSLSEAGKRAYEGQWASWLSREFTPEFLIFWVLFAYLYARLTSHESKKQGIFDSPKWKFALLIPVIATGAVISFGTKGKPHFEDEFAYLYQAEALVKSVYPGIKIEPQFQATAQLPNLFYNNEGILVGVYSIGYPLFLAPFVAFDQAWLGTFFLQALSLALLGVFLGKCGRQSGVLYLCVGTSPWLCLFPSWYFSQSLVMVLLLLICIRRSKKFKSLGVDFWLCGLIFLVRPPDGIIVFSSLMIWNLLLRKGVGLFPIWFFWSWPLHFYNQKLITGSWFESTYTVFSDYHKLGFGSEIGIHEPWGFSLVQAVKNFFLVLLSLNDVLLGWPQLSLVLVLMGGYALWLRRASWGEEIYLYLTIVFFWFGLYFCYFYPGIAFGPRFHFPLIPLFFWLMGEGILLFWRVKNVCLVFVPVSCFFIFSFSGLFFNSAGVITDPMSELESSGVDVEGYALIVIPEFEGRKAEEMALISTYRSLFCGFYSYNNVFDGRFKFVRLEDFKAYEDWYRKKFGERILTLSLSSEKVWSDMFGVEK